MVRAYDIAVVGGGVMGLNVALAAVRAGQSVVLIERHRCGAGASATPLGALLPHIPDAPSERKAFQFAALTSLPSHLGSLEAETGLAIGYHRHGRLVPIRRAGFLARMRRAEARFGEIWRTDETGFSFSILPPDARRDLLDPASCPLGIAHDTLSARLSAPAYVEALRTALAGRVTLLEGEEFQDFDTATGRLRGSPAVSAVSCGRLVVAGGWQSYPLLERLGTPALGAPVWGTVALVAASLQPAAPVICDDGLYVVPQTQGRVAVGSTADGAPPPEGEPSHALSALLARARGLVTGLAEAPLVATWSGARPRSSTGNPLVGPLEPEARIWAATGGYKISLAIAHVVAAALVEEMTGGEPGIPLPASFRAAAHFPVQQR